MYHRISGLKKIGTHNQNIFFVVFIHFGLNLEKAWEFCCMRGAWKAWNGDELKWGWQCHLRGAPALVLTLSCGVRLQFWGHMMRVRGWRSLRIITEHNQYWARDRNGRFSMGWSSLYTAWKHFWEFHDENHCWPSRETSGLSWTPPVSQQRDKASALCPRQTKPRLGL